MKIRILKSFSAAGGHALVRGDILDPAEDIAVDLVMRGLAEAFHYTPENTSLPVPETTSLPNAKGRRR